MLNNNGSALTKKRAQQILDSGLTRLVQFRSLTMKLIQSKVGSISLDRVKRNIFNFLELKEKGGYKLPIVGVSFCVLKQNENEVDDFKNYWKDIVDIVSIQRFVPPTLNKEKYKHFYSSDQFNEKPLDSFNCVQPYQRIIIRNTCLSLLRKL